MSQSFSLYRELTVRQNLDLHARLFDLAEAASGPRIHTLMETYDLTEVADSRPENLPLGIRQRLQLAVAVLHRPAILILDEPTSGVDPIARDLFWQSLIDLSRNNGVTIFISTHFMNEAARCDRISLMNAGKVLAAGAPSALAEARGARSLEDAFIAYLEESEGRPGGRKMLKASAIARGRASPVANPLFAPGRFWAYARRETVELLRDRLRLAFALLGPIVMMVTFGFGISFDVEHLPFAAFDQDRSLESRTLLKSFEGSRYFKPRPEIVDVAQMQNRLMTGELALTVEIPPGFGKDLLDARTPEIGILLDAAMPFRAETARGYVTGVMLQYFNDQSMQQTGRQSALMPINIETRFLYNQDFLSVFAIVPGVIMLMLVLIPAMMTAVSVVQREGDRVDRQLPLDAGDRARIPARQAGAIHHHSFREFSQSRLSIARPVRRVGEGIDPCAARRRPALCARDDRLRPPRLLVHAHPGRRHLRDGHHFDHSLSQLFRPSDAGVRAVGGRSGAGARISGLVVPTDQHRYLHQGPGVYRPVAEPCGTPWIRPRVHRGGNGRAEEAGNLT